MRTQDPITRNFKVFALFWPSLSDWGTPGIMGWAAANESARCACVAMAAEWQTFVGRRINEDIRLLQELSAAKASDDAWRAWCQFWQNVAADYSNQYAAIAKRAADLMPYGTGTVVAEGDGPTTATRAKAA